MLVQKVINSSVEVDSKIVSKIDKGFLVFVVFTFNDNYLIIDKMINKLLKLRIFEDENKEAHLYKAFDKNKDQSYFLGQLTTTQVGMSLFPLASLTKNDVRNIAKKAHLTSVMNKKDSTGICFIGERNFKQFLNNYLPSKEGNIVDIVTNKVIARHDGVLYYTVGQHKGLNIGGIKGRDNLPFFVVGKDVKKNILYVAQEKDNNFRFSSCLLTSFNWIGSDIPSSTYMCNCKFRYRGEDKKVKLTIKKIIKQNLNMIITLILLKGK